MAKITEDLLPHPHYSPDLAPFVFIYIYPQISKNLLVTNEFPETMSFFNLSGQNLRAHNSSFIVLPNNNSIEFSSVD
jgi:hypothetical protein